jgi:hypothetical protein
VRVRIRQVITLLRLRSVISGSSESHSSASPTITCQAKLGISGERAFGYNQLTTSKGEKTSISICQHMMYPYRADMTAREER